jgi:hypothetical protein
VEVTNQTHSKSKEALRSLVSGYLNRALLPLFQSCHFVFELFSFVCIWSGGKFVVKMPQYFMNLKIRLHFHNRLNWKCGKLSMSFELKIRLPLSY